MKKKQRCSLNSKNHEIKMKKKMYHNHLVLDLSMSLIHMLANYLEVKANSTHRKHGFILLSIFFEDYPQKLVRCPNLRVGCVVLRDYAETQILEATQVSVAACRTAPATRFAHL